MVQGYPYSGDTPIGVTVSGPRANKAFRLHAITQGDNNTYGRRNDLAVNGRTASTTNTDANSFIEGNNLALFSGRDNALGQIVPTDTRGAGEANLNGLQLAVGVPEPATWAMMIVGIGGVGGAMRRRRARHRAAAPGLRRQRSPETEGGTAGRRPRPLFPSGSGPTRFLKGECGIYSSP